MIIYEILSEMFRWNCYLDLDVHGTETRRSPETDKVAV